MNYYNENDSDAAAWLRELITHKLIPAGDVDTRSITDVQPNDLRPYTQCHFFAGIGGWSNALQLANWPADRHVWTGSCPCQPFSAAGKGLAQADERHLWPVFFDLIRQCRPDTVFGEQVEGAVRKGWLDDISADLEGEGYAVGSAVLGAHSVGAPHQRQRLYWVAYSNYPRSQGRIGEELRECPGQLATGEGGASGGLADAERGQCEELRETQHIPSVQQEPVQPTSCDGALGRLVQPDSDGCLPGSSAADPAGFWSDHRLVQCRDGKTRLIPSEPAFQPLAHGVPARVVRLRGYGNAIVPQVAAAFIQAFDSP